MESATQDEPSQADLLPDMLADTIVTLVTRMATEKDSIGAHGRIEGHLKKALNNAPDETISAVVAMLEEVRAAAGSLQAQIRALQDARTDQNLHRTLREVRDRSGDLMVTEESWQQGEAFMKQMRADAAVELQKRVQRKQLIGLEEFNDLLQVSTAEIDSAIETGEMFYLIGPDGDKLYPAFYTDDKYNLNELKKVSQILIGLPPSTRYHFFFRNCHGLGGKTPLEALTNGQLAKVITAATSFVDR